LNKEKKRRILFIIVEDRYFISHRLHLAKFALKKGYEVGLICRVSKHKEFLKKNHIKVFNWSLVRGSFNPFHELKAFIQLFKIFIKFSPSIIHAVALKPVIYSSIASKLVFIKSRVFALGGLGFIFSSDKMLARFLRPIVVVLLKFAFIGKGTRLIIQNKDDSKTLTNLGVAKGNKIELIKGAGVDTEEFSFVEDNSDIPEIILPARLLWDKGVGEFVEAARILNKKGVNAIFSLVGEIDPHNPECISQKKIDEWKQEGVVNILGFRDDMVNCIQDSSIVCLPSYREGLPKSLLEAASCGRPIVTTDVPGCREIVKDGINGFLVPSKDSALLADSLYKLIIDKNLRKEMGRKGRELVERELSAEIVSIKTEQVWNNLLNYS
jgi:glycosyltransferase involved in cell wall biosynthesis